MAADPQIVELGRGIGRSFFSWHIWWPIIKILWPFWLLAFFVFIYRFFVEPKLFRRIDKWKKDRKKKKE